MSSGVRTAMDWMFRDRRTGRLVVVQRPNVPLALWLGCVVTGWLVHPTGFWATALDTVGTIALVVWAGDEVARGVNPWRRGLGVAVLASLLLVSL